MSDIEDANFAWGEAEERPQTAAAGGIAAVLNRFLPALRFGRLRVVLPSGGAIVRKGAEPGPDATVIFHRGRGLRRLVSGGDVGFAEGYLEGDWTTPDLVATLRLASRNENAWKENLRGARLVRWVNRLRHVLRGNSRRGSRRNIEAHYDLGNGFYRLWLDANMQYSSALWDDAPDLEAAQARKLARIGELLAVTGGESVLEIGCGWGGLALSLAERGADVTAITISPSQLAWASRSAAERAKGARVDFRLQDYRDVSANFDRIVSIEMLEAVGEAWWPAYFGALARCLKSGGRAVIQAITIADNIFDDYRRNPDFIQKHIFPGGFLPSKSALAAQIAAAGLRLAHSETFGASYARTLAEWRKRFHAHWPEIEAQGFDQRFRRLWDYYLCYCEAGFAEGVIDVGLFVLEPATAG
ncbi:MAG: class I SAM-dependent methyltransferase [Bradyrhizobium sp.]|nr:MAG: class I SAM-dependent methyltransferase [Bradyrhizobium sp.]